ncbi:hypothetical protein RFI_21800, partial [Reticulomyxa filosa]
TIKYANGATCNATKSFLSCGSDQVQLKKKDFLSWSKNMVSIGQTLTNKPSFCFVGLWVSTIITNFCHRQMLQSQYPKRANRHNSSKDIFATETENENQQKQAQEHDNNNNENNNEKQRCIKLDLYDTHLTNTLLVKDTNDCKCIDTEAHPRWNVVSVTTVVNNLTKYVSELTEGKDKKTKNKNKIKVSLSKLYKRFDKGKDQS